MNENKEKEPSTTSSIDPVKESTDHVMIVSTVEIPNDIGEKSPFVLETPIQEEMTIDEPDKDRGSSSVLPEPNMTVRKEQNVLFDGPISYSNPFPNSVTVSLPSDTSKRVEEVIKNMPNIVLGETTQGDKWASTIRDSLGLNTYDDTFLTTLEDEKADFQQTLNFNEARYGSHEVKFKERQNSTFDGELAVLRTISHLGLGSTWNTGLFNSGIWITFKPPSEEDLVELYRQLTADQIEMGRSSYGLVYANTSSFVIERLCRFAMQHVYRINSKPDEIGPANALSLIKAQDISSLLWGFACTMFPKGFGYKRACMADPTKCQHLLSETLNLRKLQVINRSALTDRQKAHMAEHRGQTKLTTQDMKLYESEMIRAQNRRVVINQGEKNEIAFMLRSPSIAEYIETGHRWIDDMVNTVEQVLGSSSTFDERNKLIDAKSRATIMRQYCHWVSSIEFDSNLIEDQISIERTISSISGDKVIRETFLTEIKKFIENSSVAIIGIPTYDCPSCGKANEGPITYPHRTSMIPLDVIQLFFVLLTQKHRDLANR